MELEEKAAAGEPEVATNRNQAAIVNWRIYRDGLYRDYGDYMGVI